MARQGARGPVPAALVGGVTRRHTAGGRFADPGAAALPAEIVIRAPGAERVLGARLRPWLGGVVLDAPVAGLADLGPGPYPILLRLGSAQDRAEVPLGLARVTGPSRLRVEGLARMPTSERTNAVARWELARGPHALLDLARALVRRLPDRPRRWVRAAARRLR